MLKKILVPHDNSKPADNAVIYATMLAKSITNNCEIILLHVVPNVPASPLLLERPVKTKTGEVILLSQYIKQLYEQMQINAIKMLEKKKKEIEEEIQRRSNNNNDIISTKVQVKVLTILGDSVPDKIIEIAEEEKADLIVIGNIGLSGIAKLKTLGSVSRAVSERSTSCPVLIVH